MEFRPVYRPLVGVGPPFTAGYSASNHVLEARSRAFSLMGFSRAHPQGL